MTEPIDVHEPSCRCWNCDNPMGESDPNMDEDGNAI